MTPPKRMDFRKRSKRGGWGHFQSKNLRIYVADFGPEDRGFVHVFPKMWGGGVWNFSENSSVLVASPVPKQIHFSQERAGYILEYQICPLVPLILIKKCLFPSFPLVCALGRPASMPVTSPRWDILGKLEKEEAMDYLQT